MSNTQTSGITLRDDEYPLLTPTIINQVGIEKNSTVMPFGRLVLLNTALDALQPYPPNNHTVLFQDSIQCQNSALTQTSTLSNNALSIPPLTGSTTVTIKSDPVGLDLSNVLITDNTNEYLSLVKNSLTLGELTTGKTGIMNQNGLLFNNLPATQTAYIDNGNGTGKPSLNLDDIATSTRTIVRDDFMQITNTSTNDYYSFNQDTLQIDNPTNPSYIRMNPYDGLRIQNDTKSGAPTSTNTFTHSNISIDNALGGGPTNTITAGDVTINDNGSINVSQLTSDYVAFTTPAYQGQVNANSLSLNDLSGGYTTLISPATALFNDPVGNIQTELITDSTSNAQPYIRMQNASGLNNYYYQNSINADGHNCFVLDNNEKFFKQVNPFSFKQYELLDGDFIEKYMPFVFVQNISSIKLYDYTQYLDDNGDVGWSCIVSNYTGSDIQIDTHGLNYYSHFGGLNPGPITFKKWATARITLVYSSIDAEYLYAVSLF